MPLQHTKNHFPHKWMTVREDHPWLRKRGDDGEEREEAAGLPVQAVLLLAVHGLFAAANALSGTFVNVYLWKVSNDFILIGWFTLAHQLGQRPDVLAGGKMGKGT